MNMSVDLFFTITLKFLCQLLRPSFQKSRVRDVIFCYFVAIAVLDVFICVVNVFCNEILVRDGWQ